MLPMYKTRKTTTILIPISLYRMQHTCPPSGTTNMYDTATHMLPWRCNPHAQKCPRHTCYPGGATPMHENAPSTFNLLPGGATHMHKIVPSAFYYLIYHSKTIRDIQFLLWQRWSFLTDKVLTFPSIYFHFKMIYPPKGVCESRSQGVHLTVVPF